MRRIVILGGGFAGLSAVRTLKQELGALRRVELTLISDRAHFVATPYLSKVASGAMKLRKATVPLSRATGKKIGLEIDHITSIDTEERKLVGSRDYPFDYLIAAPGSVSDVSPHFVGRAVECRTPQDYVNIFERVKSAFRAPSAPGSLTFVVAGAGPCGVELAANLATEASRLLLADLSPSRASEFQVILVESSDQVLPHFPPALSDAAFDTLTQMGVQIRLNCAVTDADSQELTLSDQSSITSQHLFWCGGVKPHPLVEPLQPQFVKGTLESTVCGGVFLAGDIVADRPSRRNAYHAIDQGRVAARNVSAQLSGRSTRRFGDENWPTILELGDAFIVNTHRNDILVGRPARVYAASQRAKLLGPWLGRVSMVKNMLKVAAARVPEHVDPALLEDWD